VNISQPKLRSEIVDDDDDDNNTFLKFTPEQATKTQRGSRGIALLFL